ncbi:SMP-30/gluconolactonase/LRE family protein [Paraburkholderia sp.]|uniref:SMP-30/gluconolactonase/LRE family protein n=1 Tax=Paraburkholderia sp. TaxID=1926495 RepID=UPI0039E63F93
MTSTASTQVLLRGLSFGEGARWHDGKLWFSDFYTHRVQTVDLDGHTQVIAQVPQRPSGLGFLPDGTPLVVSMLDHRLLAIDSDGCTRLVADLSEVAGGPCNDMVVDRHGRAYVGNFGYDKNNGAESRLTRIIRVDPDGSIHPTGAEVSFPNGMVITPDAKHLIVGETFAHRLSMFDIDARGDLHGHRYFAELEGCNPDGLALDAEGAVWVADPFGKRVLRVFEGGRIEREITFEPGRGAYTCALGGPQRRTLFIVTNTASGPRMAEHRECWIETIEVDVPGSGWP